LNKGGNSQKKNYKKKEEPNLRLNECQLVILTKKKAVAREKNLALEQHKNECRTGLIFRVKLCQTR
jgi:hypothetical protein